MAFGEHATLIWWPVTLPDFHHRRQSIEHKYVVDAKIANYTGRFVPLVEHAAGLYLSGAGYDQFDFVDQSGRSAVRGGYK